MIMSFDFSFRSLQDEGELPELETFLRNQSLGYPGYQDWITKAIWQILNEDKKVILFYSGRTLVGDLIFQKHRDFERVREVKNCRVHPELRDRYCGTFMFRQVEEIDKNSYDAIILDVRSNQPGLINTAKSLGYEELLRVPLYERGIDEVVMGKRFERTPEGFFVPIKRDLFSH
jgi:ribosomal protein S18 acetylase RimI-like enzyme